ncbi:MAG TPA: hypothetical protein VF988_04285, partial [Verrucomicrobiae bacterium]
LNPKTEVEEADAIRFGEPAVVGRVTPCAPSWYNRMRLLAGAGAQRSARPTAPDWRLAVSTPTSIFGLNVFFEVHGSFFILNSSFFIRLIPAIATG